MTPFVAVALLLAAVTSQRCPKSNRVCNNPGECCSSEGWCGTSDLHCNNQYDFTTTTMPTTTRTTSTTLTPNGTRACPQCPVCTTASETASETTSTISTTSATTVATTESTEEEEEPPVFENHCNCIIYGDPHVQMWNCEVHSWQGPHYEEPCSVHQVTRCAGSSIADMPFDIIGVIQRYDTFFTSLDYTVLKLFDDSGRAAVCIKNKGNTGVMIDEGCTDAYEESDQVSQNTVTSFVNDKFDISWEIENGWLSNLYVDVKGNECGIDLTIKSATATASEESTEIRLSDCYKQHSCGLCGDFTNTGLEFKNRGGNVVSLPTGAWGGGANDESAFSYCVSDETTTLSPESSTTQIPQRRRLADEEPSEPCFGLMEKVDGILDRFDAGLGEYSRCCWQRKGFCEKLMHTSPWDACACVMSNAQSLKHALEEDTVGMCVEKVLNDTMSFVCELDPESFINPDMSIYDTENEGETVVMEGACVECEAGLNIFIGIVIGLAVAGMIGACLYCFVVRPRMGKEVHFGGWKKDNTEANTGVFDDEDGIQMETNTR